MAQGGIYDQVGGGFSRYSTDDEWLVPHFEKMLYDNALLSRAYLEAYQVTGKEEYARIAREIFTYLFRDMTDKQGGFYSAEDADSEGHEGKVLCLGTATKSKPFWATKTAWFFASCMARRTTAILSRAKAFSTLKRIYPHL